MNKEKIALLVDSCTDVPDEMIEKYNMFVIPLKIIYKDHVYTDKVDITAEDVYQNLTTEIPSTSLPDGQEITTIFDKIKAEGYQKVIVVTISSGLSGTNNLVRLIAEQYTSLDVFVLDTKNIGIGSGMQGTQAGQLIAEGLDWETIKTTLSATIAKSKVFFCVDTLLYLQKGGRIGLVSSILGGALNLRPIISCNTDGVYYTVSKVRGRKKSLARAVQLATEFIGTHKRFNLAIVDGAAKPEAKEIAKELQVLFPNAEAILEGPVGPALGVHTGPGLIGIGIQLLD
ncbi:DegV family protein [Carnobacterium gallinarum]|uniref:DegV family protein n=1 Tax=Carnobacterium gallinarum TaxID=2749 RepID=UPI00054E1E54|nr:DegV family protein [Carnobacterium gallinarum]